MILEVKKTAETLKAYSTQCGRISVRKGTKKSEIANNSENLTYFTEVRNMNSVNLEEDLEAQSEAENQCWNFQKWARKIIKNITTII